MPIGILERVDNEAEHGDCKSVRAKVGATHGMFYVDNLLRTDRAR